MEGTATYLPASILSHIVDHAAAPKVAPFRQIYSTCVLFADVSGFTKLCEAMAAKGPTGDEYLAKHLNSYFELLVRTISSQGGDIFKFAGDAILVVWPPSSEDLPTLARRATQCAIEVNSKLQNVQMEEGVTLNVKVGVGMGEICIIHVGGVFNRLEYLAVGEPLVQAFHAEHHATKTECVVSPEVWKNVSPYFTANVTEDGYAILQACTEPLKKVSVALLSNNMSSITPAVLKQISHYIPSAVVPFVQHKEEKWAAELRWITVLFVNLGLSERELNSAKESDTALNLASEVLSAVQNSVYRYEGSLNKFLMDDKGSTLVAVFGLPPLAHADDAVRGILSSLAIIQELTKLGRKSSIGVTTGQAFCGVVGTRGSREYSCLGDTVNLSARLMQHAGTLGGGIIIDGATEQAARSHISLDSLGEINVKGKTNAIKIFKPESDASTALSTPKVEKFSGLGIGGILSRAGYPGDVTRAVNMLKNTYFISDETQLKVLGAEEWLEIPATMRSYLAEAAGCVKCCRGPEKVSTSPSPSPSVKKESGALAGMSNFSKSKRSSFLNVSRPSVFLGAVTEKTRHILGLKDQIISYALTHSFADAVSVRTLQHQKNLSQSQSNPTTPSSSVSRYLGTIAEFPPSASPSSSSSAAAAASSSAAGGSSVSSMQSCRVLLPGDLGMLSIAAGELVKLSDLKKAVWTLIKNKKVIHGVCNASKYSFFLQPPHIQLVDPEMLLSTIPCATSRVVFILAKNDEDNDDCMQRARALILDKLDLLLARKTSHCIVIKGKTGMGKTHLLTSTFVDDPHLIYCGSASTFHSKLPLAIWQSVLHQLIDAECMSDAASAASSPDISSTPLSPASPASPSSQFGTLSRPAKVDVGTPAMKRALWMVQTLKEIDKQSKGTTKFFSQIGCLPKFLDITVEEDKKVDMATATTWAKNIFLAVITWVAKSHACLILLDNTMHCDPVSWQLILSVSQIPSNIFLVLTTCPYDKVHMPPFRAPGIPVELTTIIAQKNCSEIQLGLRADSKIVQIACNTFGPLVQKLPEALQTLIVSFCRGNPTVVKPFCFALMQEEFVFVQEDMITLSHKLQYNKALLPMPTNLLTMEQGIRDRLSHHQRMLLKVCAIAEKDGQIDVAAVKSIYPLKLEENESLDKEIQGLQELGILESCTPASGKKMLAGCVCFVSGVLKTCLLKTMTEVQKAELGNRVHTKGGGGGDSSEEGEDDQNGEKIFGPSVVREGYLSKRAGMKKSGAWQRRYCVLYDDRMEYYKNKTDKKFAGVVPFYPDTVINRDQYKDHTFGIVPEPGQREYIFKIKPASLTLQWVKLVEEQIAVQTSKILSGMLKKRSFVYNEDSD